LQRYHNFSIFKMAADSRLGFLNSGNLNGWKHPEV